MRKDVIIDYIRIIVGVTMMAVAVTVFFQPAGIVTGGASGLSIIIATYVERIFSIRLPLSVLNAVFNIPLLITGYIFLGRNFIWRTIFATLYFSVALAFTTFIPDFNGDFVIISVFGGVLMGTGIGLALSSYCTTGGSDLLAAIIHKLNKTIPVAYAMFVIDAAIISLGFLVFGMERGLYAIISVFISSKVIDAILEGLNFSKGAFIISDYANEISEEIMMALNRGVTGLKGRGMYTKKDTNVLLCVVSKKEIVLLKSIVKSRDPDAFLIITDVRETLGEGFATGDV